MVERVPVADGVALAVEVRPGAGPAFVLVHGLASNRRLWDGVADRLAGAGGAVASVDLRGHGDSDRPREGYGMGRVAEDVAVVLAHLGWERPLVAGQSWGGNVVLELAWRWPERLRGIACIDGGWIDLATRYPGWLACERALTPPSLDGMRFEDLERAVRGSHRDFPESGIAGVLAGWAPGEDGTMQRRLPLDRHLAALRGLWDHRPATRYPGIDVPVLLVPAGPGGTAATREVAAAEAGLPRSTTCWVTGHHDLHAQQPGRVAELLVAAAA